MTDCEVSAAVTDAEGQFPIKQLLDYDYFRKYRRSYDKSREMGLLNPCRNYLNLLDSLTDIHSYNAQHAKSFAKRFRAYANDFKQCEAVFAEVVVYRHYIRAVYEHMARRIELHESEADVIVERPDGSKMFLEVFSICPDFPDKPGIAYDVKTHTQKAMGSIRQKLLRKIKKQRQLSTPRENYAVIELNDMSIANDFSILSSLSGGYKVQLDANTLRRVSSGYDWRNNIFEDPATEFLTGIVWFFLGDYSSRKFLPNPHAARISRSTSEPEPFELDKFLNNPNPKRLDPDRVVTASEPFNVDDLVRTIHEGRDVRPRNPGRDSP